MLRRWIVGWVVVAAATMGTLVASADDGAKPPDLNGNWKLDPSRSTMPQRPDGAARGGPGGSGRGGGGGWSGRGGGGGGGWGGGAGSWSGGGRHGGGGMGRRQGGEGGADAGARSGMRPPRLPEMLHVTQTDRIVSLEDTTGAVVLEIATVPAWEDTLAQAPGAQHVTGIWKDGKLVSTPPTSGDLQLTQTIDLEDKGNTLVIDTSFKSGGGEAREFKRVYRRATGGS